MRISDWSSDVCSSDLFTEAARSPVIVKEEEPFHCIRCGKPFGTKSSIERILGALAGKHWMFQDGVASDRIKMCADCRVVSQFEAGDNPFQGKPKPVTRTTEDYLREREIEEAREKVRADRGKDPEDEENGRASV